MCARRRVCTFALAAGLVVLPQTALAQCQPGETTVLSCSARGGAKSISVCIAGDVIRYAYGPQGGAAELQLFSTIADVAHQPWNGVGRSIWEATTFFNQGYAYEAYISVDRMVEGHPTASGVNVLQGEQIVAEIACDTGTDTIGIWAVSDAKAAAGICWDSTRFRWAACNN